MASAPQLRDEFTAYLDTRGYRYQVVDQANNVVHLGFSSQSSSFVTDIFVDFDEEPDAEGIACVHFKAERFARCSDENVASVIVRLNDLNAQFRWVKFWLDKRNNYLNADADAMIFEGTSARECLSYVLHVSQIVLRGYEELGDLVVNVNNGGGGDGSDDTSPEELMRMIDALKKMLGQ
jgi:hypothetical protein